VFSLVLNFSKKRVSESVSSSSSSRRRIGLINEDDESKQFVEEGINLKNQGKFEQAFKLFEQEGNKGNARAQFNLGLMFEFGKGVAKDEMKALEWFLKSADQGHAGAQFSLGWMFANGNGVAKDEMRAFEWYLKSADQGHSDAQCNLGRMFANGIGVKQNYDEAAKFFQLSILGGSEQAKSNLLSLGNRNISQAQYLLGELYLEGRGFVKDEKKSVEWIAKSAKQHYDGAIEKLHMMAEQGHAEAQNKLCEMNETRGTRQ
jgi:uncharacterized protein